MRVRFGRILSVSSKVSNNVRMCRIAAVEGPPKSSTTMAEKTLMPQLLEHIHQIARRLKRDVLIAMPARGLYEEALLGCDAGRKRGIWRKTRQQAIAFLDAEGIKHIDCFGPASDFLIRPWLGEMFIDVPVNLEDEGYRKVCAFFEHPGETPKFSDYHLFVVQYDQALVLTDK